MLLLSGGPASAEVLWTVVDEDSENINYSDDENWIDPFAVSNLKSARGHDKIHWEVVDEYGRGDEDLAWFPVNEGEEYFLASESNPPPKPPPPELESINRSIAFSDGRVGPDIGFLVPPGFKWTPDYMFDSSIRGWSRRKPGEDFLSWNGGDAVGQFYLQPFHGENWSFGANLGIRSVYNGSKFAGGGTRAGEGVSAGFRFDYALTETAGIAIGAEQLIHFDSKTDTGRDIYLVASKGWWLGNEKGKFPLLTATGGIGTGYLGRNQNLQFGCSSITDAGIAEVDNPTFYPLCWGPIASAALVITPKLSLFGEYNNFSLVTGASIAPFERIPLRATWGATLAQDFGGGPESYQFEPKKTRWFFRVSLGL